MSDKLDPKSLILDAIRAKRERKHGVAEDIAALEASLIADIEAFDLDAAERRARREQLANSGQGMVDPSLVFPEIVPTNLPRRVTPSGSTTAETAQESEPEQHGSLLDQLRHQAEARQRELHSKLAERTSTNEAIDQALKHVFFYLHDFTQQLNIVKPGIPREYPLIESYSISQLTWQEGFSDYRTQSQSAGALVELVSFTFRLHGPKTLTIERDGTGVERFRAFLFDTGLPFSCKEYKNARQYIERAEFQIQSEISVSTRWRADFTKGVVILEARNLERLGSTVVTLAPECIDHPLLEAFGHLVLGQPNHFRELAKRQITTGGGSGRPG